MDKPTKVNGSTAEPDPTSGSPKIDRMAPAGSKNSLGAQSVRDGRPDTDDEVVEGMDEMGPGPLPK